MSAVDVTKFGLRPDAFDDATAAYNTATINRLIADNMRAGRTRRRRMSWVLSIPATPAADLDAALDKALSEFDGDDPSRKQLAAAVDAAKAIAASGHVGGRIAVSMSGHASEEPQGGEIVSMGISHVPEETEV